MKLENLNFVELSDQEKSKINGGFAGVVAVVLAVVYVGSTVYGLATGKKYPGQP
jgi:hypothetical protein